MKNLAKKLLPFLPTSWQNKIIKWRHHFRVEREIKQWIKDGKPNPPPASVKYRNLLKIARQKNLSIFVETGTYMGATINELKDNFDKLFSIELSEDLFLKAKKKFSEHPHIFLFQGDSGEILKEIIPKLDRPTLFWLDAHYSGGITARGDKNTPIINELSIIFSDNTDHTIIIDDARDFRGHGDYPSVDEIISFIQERKPNIFSIKVVDDSIRIIPKK